MGGGGDRRVRRSAPGSMQSRDVGPEAPVDGVQRVVDRDVHHGVHPRFMERVARYKAHGHRGLGSVRVPDRDRVRRRCRSDRRRRLTRGGARPQRAQASGRGQQDNGRPSHGSSSAVRRVVAPRTTRHPSPPPSAATIGVSTLIASKAAAIGFRNRERPKVLPTAERPRRSLPVPQNETRATPSRLRSPGFSDPTVSRRLVEPSPHLRIGVVGDEHHQMLSTVRQPDHLLEHVTSVGREPETVSALSARWSDPTRTHCLDSPVGLTCRSPP